MVDMSFQPVITRFMALFLYLSFIPIFKFRGLTTSGFIFCNISIAVLFPKPEITGSILVGCTRIFLRAFSFLKALKFYTYFKLYIHDIYLVNISDIKSISCWFRLLLSSAIQAKRRISSAFSIAPPPRE